MTSSSRPAWHAAAGILVAVLLSACASPRPYAPVEARTPVPRPGAAAPAAPAAAPPRPAPVETVAKPGEYIVKPGDTLIRIGLETGQNWRDLMRWNGLENPNVIEVGQVLRVVAPPGEATAVAVRPAAGTAEVRPIEPRPLPPASASGAAGTGAAPAGAATAPAASVAATPPVATPPATPAPAAPPAANRDGDEDITWGWPAIGTVASAFDESRNKGLAIVGRAGDPVLAAADGRVVYAGAGIRGYGNLLIVKHNNLYISAYAHNQALLVKEDQVVRRGQKIAEMGATDADRVQLHFEIRRQGRPVDPARLLPPR